MTPKERMNLRAPEDIVIRRELDGDEVAEVKWHQERSGGEVVAGEEATVDDADNDEIRLRRIDNFLCSMPHY
jgi:hypothetical protein